MSRKPTGISEPDFYDFLETAWSLSDSQLSRAISFLTDIQQRRATYGTCQAMADQRTKEMPQRTFARNYRLVSSKISGFVLDGLQFCPQRAEHGENHPLS